MASRSYRYRPSRRGKPARVYLAGWVDAEQAGKLLLATGMALESYGWSGIGDGIELLAKHGWRRLVRGLTPEDIERIGARVALAYPGLVRAADLVRRAKRFRPDPGPADDSGGGGESSESSPESSQGT